MSRDSAGMSSYVASLRLTASAMAQVISGFSLPEVFGPRR
jgi:hypothetical protein